MGSKYRLDRRRFLGSIAYPAAGVAALAVLAPRLTPQTWARTAELAGHNGRANPPLGTHHCHHTTFRGS